MNLPQQSWGRTWGMMAMPVRAAALPIRVSSRWAPLLLCLTLLVFLFRPPDVQMYGLDRLAFVVLALTSLWRALLPGKPLRPPSALVWPMLALAGLAAIEALSQPFDAQTWSLLAAKFIVPFTMFYLASLVLDKADAAQTITYCLLGIFGYLVCLAIVQLAGLDFLVWPRYILNPDLGVHADRARGPFLQAVPNGVTITALGLIAFGLYQRGSLRQPLACILLLSPIAILATKTRAIWISFGCSVLWVGLRSHGAMRKAVLGAGAATTVGIAALILLPDINASFRDRAEERGPVEVRAALYEASWGMVLEKPILGWGPNQMPREIVTRMERYRMNVYGVHNTLLETLLELGLGGFLLQGTILVGLFRLGRRRSNSTCADRSVLEAALRDVWPVVVAVYIFNALFVVMNYQFLNALIFTLAGILAAQNRKDLHAVSPQRTS